MSEEVDLDDEATLAAAFSNFPKRREQPLMLEKPQDSLSKRREREVRPLTANTRRQLRSTAETKSVQLNMKVTPTFKRQVGALATARRVSVTEFIEQAVAAFAK